MKNSLIIQIILVFMFILTEINCKALLEKSKYDKYCVNERKNNNSKFRSSNLDNVIYCDFCNLMLPIARDLAKEKTPGYLDSLAVFACTILRIEDKTVCSQIIELFLNQTLSISEDTSLSNKDICSIALGCSPVENPIFNWNISLNETKPKPVPPVPPQQSSPKLRILHLSDIHIDFEYQPGSLAECGQPLCCRNSSTKKLNSEVNSKQAGYWGEYSNCDVPLWTVEAMFEYISKNEQFDFIYWTGDLPPHNVWHQTKSDQLNALDKLTELFLKHFPKKTIYPALGNHEATPVNLFPTPINKEDNITWLYSSLAKNWIKTGLPSDLALNITNGAFYTILISPGVRLVSLNMNFCSVLNFWLYVNSTDPMGQLAWLANILQNSENIGEKVHIIGHIHPLGCLLSFSINYYRIVNRYESTITGQFFGHTHYDQFEIFYDFENLKRPVGVAYITGSQTTYGYVNPGYRIYTVDGLYLNTSFQVLDHETYFMNLTESNNAPNSQLNFKKEYSAREAFNMTNLYPEDWNLLINKMSEDPEGSLASKLYKYYFKSADGIPTCNSKCRKNFLCTFKQARVDNFIKC